MNSNYSLINQLIQAEDLASLQAVVEHEGAEAVKISEFEEDLAGLHLASGTGNVDLVRFYLDDPVNENPSLARGNNFTPLHSSAMFGHTDVVKLLLDRGANVNAQTDPQKYAPIHSASFGGHLETIKVLVANGADIRLKNYRDEYPIDTARRQGQDHVVEYFDNLMSN